VSNNESSRIPSIEEAKAALREAERAYNRVMGVRFTPYGSDKEVVDLRACDAAAAALRSARDQYALAKAMKPKPRTKGKSRDLDSQNVEP
jgi:hypothetical protein